MTVNLDRLNREIMPATLFPKPPVIKFVPENMCSCGTRCGVQKTRCKTVFTMNGPLKAHETIMKCPACDLAFSSDALLHMVPKWCNVAYDVLVFVGRAMFLRYRTVQEVHQELLGRNVKLSCSEISYLARKFILFLAVSHYRAAARIRQSMQTNGGYVLHLDATHDGDAPALMTGVDSLSKIVLGNIKVPTEHSSHIVPFLKQLQSLYGTPKACVHDMGKGICKAVTEVFPAVPDYICHFHFLRDIGKDYLDPAYRILRSRLRHHKASTRLCNLIRETKKVLEKQDHPEPQLATFLKAGEISDDHDQFVASTVYSLSLWVLHGKQCGNAYGFPFDRPLLEFARRIVQLKKQTNEMVTRFPAMVKNAWFNKLVKILIEIGNDKQIQIIINELQWRCQVFDRLRAALRIAMPTGTNGLNDEGTDIAIFTIKQAVEQFRKELDHDSILVNDKLSCKMATQIDKYNKKLFADPIEVNTPAGTVTIYPQRTNNILEQFFRGVRRGHRRKTGDNSMHRLLQTMLADTPLVKNLDNQEYMKILLNGKASLEELFAELEMSSADLFATRQTDVDHILPGYQTLKKNDCLPSQILQVFSVVKIGSRFN